ncbi:SOS response-associated peptidase [Streptacidiphilus sp. PB12-B1b]|uniref:SOS response-associated peptidase n=1 Tax=Streptacidiphilus sp. PB12-B1b TaxID=2705012 RepID=UPI0015FA7D7A|nr:SOS response-associated peptidase [Streptacidiphilus sp. PB12-B1b]QMU75251.1 SOS response-associated peptidase [Streptacidiphilus sp. PB12-B1b]
MCGRYASSRKPEDLARLFGVESWDPDEAPAPAWNIAPTVPVHAVLERPLKGADPQAGPVRQLRPLRWGLVPSWAQSPAVAVKMINARSETVHEKPAYRRCFASRRCLLPADGYYEWVAPEAEPGAPRKGRAPKQAYFITPADGSVMAMAGLYEFWRDPKAPQDHPDAWWATCTVITTAAEPALAAVHPRMPLALTPDSWDAWLDPALNDPERVRALLVPPPPGLMEVRPVSAAVGSVRNDGPELQRRWQPVPAEGGTTLF